MDGAGAGGGPARRARGRSVLASLPWLQAGGGDCAPGLGSGAAAGAGGLLPVNSFCVCFVTAIVINGVSGGGRAWGGSDGGAEPGSKTKLPRRQLWGERGVRGLWGRRAGPLTSAPRARAPLVTVDTRTLDVQVQDFLCNCVCFFFFTFLIKLVQLITRRLPVFPGLWGMMQPPPP